MGDNDWRDKLSAGMESYSEPVPDSVWNAVSAEVCMVWDRQRRVRRRRRMYAAAASVFAAAAVVAAVLSPGASDPARIIIQPGPLLADSAGSALPDGMSGLRKAAVLGDFPRRIVPPVPESPSDESPSDESPDAPDSGYQPDPFRTERPAEMTGSATRLPSDDEPPADTAPDLTGTETLPDPFGSVSDEEPSRSRPRLSLSLRASNLASGSTRSAGYSGMYGSAVTPSTLGPKEQVNSYSSVLLNNNSMEVGTDTRYWQPVSVGVAASLGLNDLLSIEAGLNYSCLVSDLSSGTAENRYDIRQTLHYIGIPFRVRCSLWTPGHFDVYLTAGGEVEKCVYGTSVTTYFVNGSPSSDMSARIRDDRLQWSAGVSAGLSYRFNDHIGIYAEPGVSWHFRNGSFIESVYSERPLNFSLALGLRFYLN